MATEQPYLEIEGDLYWISSKNEGTGKAIHTYLMSHVQGELKITSPVELDTGFKKRIVKIEEYSAKRPIMTTELFGTTMEEGSFEAKGIIVDAIPENGINIKQHITDLLQIGHVDRTNGKGTIWEQLSRHRADDDQNDEDNTD